MTSHDRTSARIEEVAAGPITPDNARTRAHRGSSATAIEGDSVLPLTVYGPEVSYFTGKLEAVIRFMELPYRAVAKGPAEMARPTGVAQVPGLQLADGRWLTDTTPIIAWLDDRYPGPAVIPRDPALAFFSRLLEDYADEWLWRPAMHYRWDYPEGAYHISRVLVDEAARHVPLPGFVKRSLIRNRQRSIFTNGDGVTAETWDHVEKIYLDSLAHLDAILATRPYLLGSRPSLADFGFFGPMFRHFAQDPPSARIMRETAPAVFEWVARVWNARSSVTGGELLQHVPEDWGPILDSIGSAYLPYLCANAEAWQAGRSQFDVDIEGAPYRKIRTSRYRVWCLEELRRHFAELPDADQATARERLEAHGCWVPLWQVENPVSGIDPNRGAPFSPGDSMTGMDAAAAWERHWLPVAAIKRKR
ncbi:MAG: glutathione S-transferase family protein [Myxococcales bacterium]|nr:glutathione S-transferase family protein [Myxococcales bacterium]